MPYIQIKPTSPRPCCKLKGSIIRCYVWYVKFHILYGPIEITGGGSTRRKAQICLKYVEDHINQMQWKQSDLQ